ncbi:hypothetical protein ILUMI_13015 [Ignelater luminosus]|uniref:Uncharacterized protein n=1 Tax=Ignelater luminosus TaxID=2038154 RepID=A0A8K0GCE2_IGNLU|nr:hypothetical protein ILUMI_13015 [Ignelater luminosus]
MDDAQDIDSGLELTNEEFARAGVKFIVHPDLKNIIKYWKFLNGGGYQTDFLIVAYAPNDDALVAVKDPFYKKLQTAVDESIRDIDIMVDLNRREEYQKVIEEIEGRQRAGKFGASLKYFQKLHFGVCGASLWKNKVGGKKAKRTLWWTAVKGRVREKKETWKSYISDRSEAKRELYRAKRREFKINVAEPKAVVWHEFFQFIEEDLRSAADDSPNSLSHRSITLKQTSASIMSPGIDGRLRRWIENAGVFHLHLSVAGLQINGGSDLAWSYDKYFVAGLLVQPAKSIQNLGWLFLFFMSSQRRTTSLLLRWSSLRSVVTLCVRCAPDCRTPGETAKSGRSRTGGRHLQVTADEGTVVHGLWKDFVVNCSPATFATGNGHFLRLVNHIDFILVK